MIRKFTIYFRDRCIELLKDLFEKGKYSFEDFYYSDYSENRKRPLERHLRVTDNEDQIWEIFNSWINDEMINTTGQLKRGWK